MFSRLSKIQGKKGDPGLTTRVVQEVRTTVKSNVGVRGEPECQDCIRLVLSSFKLPARLVLWLGPVSHQVAARFLCVLGWSWTKRIGGWAQP